MRPKGVVSEIQEIWARQGKGLVAFLQLMA